MKKLNLLLSVIALFAIMSCSTKKEKETVVEAPKPKVETKKFIQTATKINPQEGGQEVYYNADFNATSVDLKIEVVKHIRTTEVYYLDVKPVEITYTDGQNSATYTFPKDYLVQKYVKDAHNTIWIYGFYKGQFKEYVFFGKQQFNNKKILPNSHWGENGTIKYLQTPIVGI